MAAVLAELEQLLIYRNLLEDGLIKKLILLESGEEYRLEYELAGDLIRFAEETGIGGHLPIAYILYQVGYGRNLFSSIAEKGIKAGSGLLNAVAHDVAILQRVLSAAPDFGGVDSLIRAYQPACPQLPPNLAALQTYFAASGACSPAEITAKLQQLYGRYGYGEMATCTAFRWDWEQGLTGVRHADPVQLDDIIGYERQKQTLLENTEAFIAGRPANNVLLVGARGTGKSTSVKALANHYYEQGLRLVEVSKKDLECLPAIMNALRPWGKKFIVFLDDLSFEEFEIGYKNLKSAMDGGLEAKPDNVLIYATSNRRHLVRETWQDRSGDELHHQDSINEKISLSDRFGITLTFASPNQEEYLRIVETIAAKQQLSLSPAELRSEALRWEMSHSGRSGRLARQFVAKLAGKSL
ncbi:MAG: ATP-binding protein [Sporomusaceae bacterium]|nr:ATP-binding protein [Sporomusaceae bacterium]